MQYHTKWLTQGHRGDLLDLAGRIYSDPKPSYPSILNPESSKNPIHYFLIPDTVINHQTRKVLGVFDQQDRLVMAIATRTIEYAPVWMISWTLSTLKNAAFMIAWKQALDHLTGYFESEGINEFYVVSPCSREAVYSRLMRHLRDRYWTFVEIRVPPNTKPVYGLQWMIMGQHLYHYEINIRRYVLRRSPR